MQMCMDRIWKPSVLLGLRHCTNATKQRLLATMQKKSSEVLATMQKKSSEYMFLNVFPAAYLQYIENTIWQLSNCDVRIGVTNWQYRTLISVV
jgi:hypothetical protein